METKQLNGYRIDFYSEEEGNNLRVTGKDRRVLSIGIPLINCGKELLGVEYNGKVLNIPDKLAESIVDKGNFRFIGQQRYYNYKENTNEFKTAKESFQTLSTLPYCVITKINE